MTRSSNSNSMSDTSSKTNEEVAIDTEQLPHGGGSERGSDSKHSSTKVSFAEKWALAVNSVRSPILKVLHALASTSARNPKRTISLITLISIGLLVIGLFTNFTVEADDETVWTPKNSRAIKVSGLRLKVLLVQISPSYFVVAQ